MFTTEIVVVDCAAVVLPPRDLRYGPAAARTTHQPYGFALVHRADGRSRSEPFHYAEFRVRVLTVVEVRRRVHVIVRRGIAGIDHRADLDEFGVGYKLELDISNGLVDEKFLHAFGVHFFFVVVVVVLRAIKSVKPM